MGKVESWTMSPEELKAYVEKHPIKPHPDAPKGKPSPFSHFGSDKRKNPRYQY